MNLPADIANQALDAAAVDFTIGDLQEGTRPAQVVLRWYGQCLRQLLRSANWSFARKTADLTLLADSTGNTPNVGTVVPQPWVYEYQYPIDCMKLRFIPWNLNNQAALQPPGNIQIPQTPALAGIGQQPLTGQRIRPAKFQLANDPNYPPQMGQNWWETQGAGNIGSTVILCNVRMAQAVYTAFIPTPSVWDALFREAMVAYLSSQIALPLAKDKRFGLQIRVQQIAILKQKLTEARMADGNESTSSSDIAVDWMRNRTSGGSLWSNGAWGGGPGGGWGGDGGSGWDGLLLPDGSVF